MEISSIQSSSYYNSVYNRNNKSEELTEEDKNALAEIIVKYRGVEMDADKRQELADDLEKADIELSDKIKRVLNAAGIETGSAKSQSTAEALSSRREPSILDYLIGDNDEKSITTSNTSTDLKELLQSYKDGEISDEELSNSMKTILSGSYSSSGNFLKLEA
jgi:O-phosphoseryl-tRNA(Cys) synthetase